MIAFRRPWQNAGRLSRTYVLLVLFLCFSVGAPALSQDRTLSIKIDEQVLFFPGFAVEADGGWIAHIHGWIFEPERSGTELAELERLLLARLEVPKEEFDPLRFRERSRLFFVDNERSKEISIDVVGQGFTLAPSAANGHFKDQLVLEGTGRSAEALIDFHARTRPGDSRVFSGRIQLIGRNGISVVSDIDDTIKDSNVLVRRELIANTFGREFRSVPGMAELYRSWVTQSHAVFHYVSGSPWQLYPSLNDFVHDAGFPLGTFHLRQFRLKDRSAVEFLENRTLEFKLGVIDQLIRFFPERQFVLVGDSGEQDPEVYAQLRARFPAQVNAILIREVSGRPLDRARFDPPLPKDFTLRVFRSPSELTDFRLP